MARVDLAIYCALAAATTLVYAQVVGFEFVQADDQTYVTENFQVQQGLTFQTIVWAFGSFEGSNWHPLTWLSHMLDIELFGMWAGGHHATNLLFHVANTLLLFWVLMRMTGDRWPSALVAALFALHPLHVESVAWVSERKDVLSTCFGLLAIGAYAGAAANRGRGLGLAKLLFALSLLSKPMLVTLPFLLLLLDYWPLGRISLPWLPAVRRADGVRAVRLKQAIREKLPFLALTAGSCVLTFAAQQSGGAVKTVDVVPLALRFANAAVAYVLYLGKTLRPLELGVLYPHPYVAGTGGEPWATWQIAGSLLLLVAITFVVLRILRKPYAIVGWFWYLGTLVPVIGLVQVGNQALADRYSYVPLIGVFIALAWGGREIVAWLEARGLRAARALAALTAALVLGACAALTSAQAAIWRDSVLLFEHTLEIAPRNSIIHVALAATYGEQRKMDDAIRHAKLAAEIKPDYVDAHVNLGNAWVAKGDAVTAITHYRNALALEPEAPVILYNLANALSRLGRLEEAISEYERAIALDPRDARFWHNMGNAHRKAGRTEEARANYLHALELDPNLAVGHFMLGQVLSAEGRHAEAEAHYRRAIEIDPTHTKARYHLGRAIEAQKQ